MRLIHTADWHLGHKLHEVDRREEHEAFLDWLVETIREREADALLMSGDVFDTANPSAEAQELWYRFLARCRRRNPDVDIVVIGGNHDSAGRLDAPNPLLRELGVQIVGGLMGPVRPGRVSQKAGGIPARKSLKNLSRRAELPRRFSPTPGSSTSLSRR